MAETRTEELSPEARIARMKDLLRQMAEDEMSDAEVLGEFIDHFEAHGVPKDEVTIFYESLDVPEQRVIFGDDTFDLIVEQYDALGGMPRSELPPGATAVPSELEQTLGRAYLAVTGASVFFQPGPSNDSL